MLLLDFHCTRCKREFEALVKENEAPACPDCLDSENVERALSAFAGYTIKGDNSASVRPKRAGAFKKVISSILCVWACEAHAGEAGQALQRAALLTGAPHTLLRAVCAVGQGQGVRGWTSWRPRSTTPGSAAARRSPRRRGRRGRAGAARRRGALQCWRGGGRRPRAGGTR